MTQGAKAASWVQQILGHADGQNVISTVVIESIGSAPPWFLSLLEEAGIKVEEYSQ
ncbi:MAG: hypothetical protein U0175_34570 [Caldilineaceae bacterium]